MKETLICKLDKHCIYYLSDINFGFYILLPGSDYKETNISIRLKSNYQNYDLNRNPLEKVTTELINYYKSIDNYNVTLILPVFYDDLLMRIRTIDDLELYQLMDQYLGKIFNYAFQFLTKNGIKVNNNIYVVNNDSFKKFTNWFVARYNNRIEYKTILELIKQSDNFSSYDMVETPNINFVVGKNEIPDLAKTTEIEVETFDDFIEKSDESNKASKIEGNDKVGNSGYISYILLGIITLISFLGLLFILVK